MKRAADEKELLESVEDGKWESGYESRDRVVPATKPTCG
jgi:hypothetical protein